MTIQPTRRRFSVDEYHRMAEAGILGEDDRIELIEGEIVEMGPIGWRHHSCVMRLDRWFHAALGKAAFVSIQGPLRLNAGTEVQPDVVLLRPRPDKYASQPPTLADVLLVVEVGDSSARLDHQVKSPLYAREGIPDLWLAELDDDVVLVPRDPAPDGYRTSRIYRRGESISPLAFPDLQIPVDEILGPM